MANRRKEDGIYGQFGIATYDLEDRPWTFGRLLVQKVPFEALPPSQTLIVNTDVDTATQSDSVPPYRRLESHDRHIQALVKAHPVFQPSSILLRPLLLTSANVQGARRCYDPVRGNLMSFGAIPSSAQHRRTSVVAIATHDSHSTLTICQISAQDFVRTQNQFSQSSTKHVMKGVWEAGAGTIQQVVFGKSVVSNSKLLAVRQLDGTRIFRPFQGENRQIWPNLLHTITTEETGGFNHTDVTFNPWFPQQVALIDEAGHWIVTEFDSQRLRKVTQVWKSSLATRLAGPPSPLYDGWARITWVCSVTVIAACTRDSLSVYDISHVEPILLRRLKFASKAMVDCAIDMLLLPGHLDLLAVLTSSHLRFYRVAQSSSGEISVRSVLKVRHFQSQTDLSLCLDCHAEDDEIVVSLYSKRHRRLWRYKCKVLDTNCVQYSEPVLVRLPQSMLLSTIPSDIADLRFYPIQAMRTLQRFSQSPLLLQRFGHEPMYVLDVLLATGVLRSYLYFQPRSRDGELIAALDKKQQIFQASHNIRHPSTPFVILQEGSESQNNGPPGEEPLSRRVRRARSPNKPRNRPIKLESLFHRLQQSTSDADHISTALSYVQRTLLEPVTREGPSLKLFYEYVQSELTFRDSEDADSHIHEILGLASESERSTDSPDDQAEQRRRLTVGTVPLSLPLRDIFPEDSDKASSVYENIIETWIQPLPDTVSVRTRLAKEHLARRIATDVVLSRLMIRNDPIPTSRAYQPIPDEKPSQSLTWDIPVRGDSSASHVYTASNNNIPQPTLSLPTPSPTITPSVTTAASETVTACPEVSRLSRYTTFSKPPPLPPPRVVNNILSHWNVDEDPTNYDWLSTSRMISQRDEEADESLTDKDRRRVQRRAARHILRQRKEAAAREAQELAGSQAPEIVSASQPAAVLRNKTETASFSGMPSSSQTVDFLAVNASQVVPGRFGGRPPPAKRKKRVYGF